MDLNFTKGLNVLIGENDSGKSAIIEAIKIVLKTHSYEWSKIEPEDFYQSSDRFRIELKFEDFSDSEAKNFTEWLGWTGEGEAAVPYLRLIYDVKRNLEDNRIFASDIKAGVDSEGYQLNAEAKEYLKVTYLKPLRDAQSELVAKKNSRLSQILHAHEAFKGKDGSHHLIDLFNEFNKSIEKYFEGKKADDTILDDDKGKKLKEQIDIFIQAFYEREKESLFGVVEGNKLRNILEKLELSIKDEINPGLGTLNRLFMASELLHLHKTDWNGIRLGLIEELEVHLHPQAQMQIIEALQKENDIQLILTTHSPNIGSKLKLQNLIICNKGDAFPMGSEYTKLSPQDYSFMERFLDVTKSNLFFAKGVILVEGWSEEIILPVLAKKMKSLGIISKDMTEAGISIVNVTNTSFLRYSKIFQRKVETKEIGIPVSIVTDLDLKPAEFIKFDKFAVGLNIYLGKKRAELGESFVLEVERSKYLKKHRVISQFNPTIERAIRIEKYDGQVVKTFISPTWTLEYSIASSNNLARLLFIATRLAGREMAFDSENYSGKKIKIDWATFINKKTQAQIAFDLHANYIGFGKEISKSIIAQYFSKIIESDTSLSKVDLETDSSISYLLDAIKYASKQT